MTPPKQKRQIYKDACDRNAVEGRNGNAKRRFGLDLIAAKLDETAKTEAALILIAMNAAHRLARWLLRFFINGVSQKVGRQGLKVLFIGHLLC